MYDLHCHILYGVDDGADTVSEALEMAEIARDGGTKGIVVTPHSYATPTELNFWDADMKNRFLNLQKEVDERHLGIKLFPGQEIFGRGEFVEHLLSGELITINGSRYPLIEFPFTVRSKYVLEKMQQLIAEGFTPVIAHPERYTFVSESFDSLTELKKIGCLVQVNMGSFKGVFGHTAKIISEKILGMRMADVVASDAHSPFMRTPFLADAHEHISEKYSTDYAERLLSRNPKAIIQNKKI
ncbi:MAG: hypothetical protein J6D06_06625 [Clostridia bacterium]|nr:hypothetical protein [Clostridia bacterium]